MKGAAFTIQYSKLSKELKTQVGISTHNSKPLSSVQAKWTALWDTGATASVITKDVVEALDLKPVSVQRAATPQGTYSAYTYFIDLILPNRVMFQRLQVMEGKPAGCDILIGMDVIGAGDFAVSNVNNQTVFSYRNPSSKVIDFVKEAQEENAPVRIDPQTKPGRNSQCPCGSGKKYKQCCGKV